MSPTKKYFLYGALFGILIVPISTLGLVFLFIEIYSAPLTLVPRLVVVNAVDTSQANGAISIGLMMAVSAIFYSLIFAGLGLVAKKFNFWLALGLAIIAYAAIFFLGINSPVKETKVYVPEVKYTETFISGQPCKIDQDCALPMEYAIRSVCPFQAYCDQGSCVVACPMMEHSTFPGESVSYQVQCEVDSDCSCQQWPGAEAGDCSCLNGNCVSIVAK